MSELSASRTLLKSPPELWAECSDADSLARHLNGQFGEIRITRLEPETAVAWEGEQYRGTVRLEPSGWGTKVVLTASADEEPAALEPPVADAPAVPTGDAPAVPPAPPARGGLLVRVMGFFRAPAAAVELEPPGPPAVPEPAPSAPGPQDDLAAALDSLGQAHHRPFSRG